MGKNGTMSVGNLGAADGMTYDASMLTRKIKLRASPVSVTYHATSGTYVLVTKKRIPEMHDPFTSNDEIPKDPPTREWGDRYIPPDQEQFAVQLMSPNGWVIIPHTRIALAIYDNVTDCKTLSLKDDGSESGRKDFVVISTSRVCGEEVTAQGRIMILDILDVVPEPGQPLTKNKFKTMINEVQKGAVTCIGAVSGFLITCMVQREGGNKVYIWNFENHEVLTGIAFCHASIYITSLAVIENIEKLIIIGDLYQSISVLRFVEEAKLADGDRPGQKVRKLGGYLGKVSEDIGHNLKVTSVQFYVQNDLLSFVVTDESGNVVIHCYVPDKDEGTMGGRVLVRRADYHLGARATNMLRISCRPLVAQGGVERHSLMYSTSEGSIGNISPVPEKTFLRLQMLENKLTTGLQHRAGLNPRGYRMANLTKGKPARNILDGGLLTKFLSLGTLKQRELARRIGTSVEQLILDLHMLRHSTAVL